MRFTPVRTKAGRVRAFRIPRDGRHASHSVSRRTFTHRIVAATLLSVFNRIELTFLRLTNNRLAHDRADSRVDSRSSYFSFKAEILASPFVDRPSFRSTSSDSEPTKFPAVLKSIGHEKRCLENIKIYLGLPLITYKPVAITPCHNLLRFFCH